MQRNFERKKRGAPQRLRLRGWDLDPALRAQRKLMRHYAQRPQGMAKTAPLQSTMLRSAPLFSLKISLHKAGVKRPQFISQLHSRSRGEHDQHVALEGRRRTTGRWKGHVRSDGELHKISKRRTKQSAAPTGRGCSAGGGPVPTEALIPGRVKQCIYKVVVVVVH